MIIYPCCGKQAAKVTKKRAVFATMPSHKCSLNISEISYLFSPLILVPPHGLYQIPKQIIIFIELRIINVVVFHVLDKMFIIFFRF